MWRWIPSQDILKNFAKISSNFWLFIVISNFTLYNILYITFPKNFQKAIFCKA